ncbi:DNA topoisomerase 2-like [Brachypodium distachyon]|uniref:DNA topoisomerase (ATP-hydrolyzing) n=1 Tax=Brachypodium distachyon TaxID=15368 RepID=A0A2K2D217_BRADI|nr:DNA topoisomerase 2-like [Brachypodium distachyon]PNT68326.1 hypothetical protein BRADI_3g38850v3 [Brachypodium distachyon]|eukprot:XP_024318102.1 DNA topoisomerase 2-like [Brachypodium distachyon]
MVLVNGSRGCNSNVPSYNPRDIIANLRRLLNYEHVEPMDPWYRGFKGRIEKISTTVEGSTYSTTGVIKVVDETTLVITELPIHCWTKDYRCFIKSLSKNRKNKTNEFRIKLIKDKCCDDMNLQLKLILEEKNMEKVTEESLEKKLNLITTVGTTNMHLFDRNGINIRKYKTPEEILEEFFGLRLEYYEKRKKAQLDSLDLDLWKITNKVRFILSVGRGDITVLDREAYDLVLELYRKGFSPFPTSSESPEGGKRVLASDYEYLLSIPIGSMAREKLHELYAEKTELEEKIKEVRRSKPRLLWIKDLDALEVELDRFDDLKRAEIERLESLRNRKKPTKKTTANDGEAGVCKPVKSKPAAQKKGKTNTKATVIEIVHDEVPLLEARPANNVVDSSSAHTEGLQVKQELGGEESQRLRKRHQNPQPGPPPARGKGRHQPQQQLMVRTAMARQIRRR